MKRLLSISIFFSLFYNYSIAQSSTPPKLVVGIVVDQMCYDYLYRFQDRFSTDGFRKLMEYGVNCRNTHFNYMPTYTAPGHASIYSGTTPSNHKIVANDWYSRELKKEIYCVEDTLGRSPRNLKALTITDQLKLTYPNAKVFSLSIKDRSAVLPGGHLSNGSFWYDDKTGKIKTSDYYKKNTLSWLDEFNNRNYVKKAFEKGWVPMFQNSSYASWYSDSSKYEQSIFKSNKFPYDLKGKFSEKEECKLFTYLPEANTFLTDFALEMINHEQLGKDKTSDFLCVSYSSTDILGHAFGPYSHELEDMYIRLDLELARLISYLEKNIGKENFVLFLTADHAVLPVPQMLVDLKLPGGYFYLNELETKLRQEVIGQFKSDFILKIMNNNVYFDRELIQNKGIDYNEALMFVRNKIEHWENVFQVYTANELKSNQISDDNWSKMVLNGFDKELSGDILYVLNPGFLSKKHEGDEASFKGTSHGSPFGYDTQVPLLFYGKNIKHRDIFRKIEIVDIVPTLAPILNIAQPSTTTGTPILEVLNQLND
jgi:predicted AlkP superfamily pyrophosphatase or phosphodiesterase